jgi:hypothetical protein
VAIDCCGDEIEVVTPATVDVRDYLWRLPPGDTGQGRLAYVGIRYLEQQEQPVPVTPGACGCEETIFEPSRIRDSYQIDILWETPPAGNDERVDLCSQQLAPCPQCPDNPFVFLAQITIPASEGDPISRDHIDNGIFRS